MNGLFTGAMFTGAMFTATMFTQTIRYRACRILFAATILPALAFAQGKSWHVADFKDTISISADGSALVSEKISVVFVGEWHGIHRTIPVEYPGPNGSNYTLFLKVLSVTDGDGNKLKYDSSKSGPSRDLKIYIPDAVDATRVVNIDYSVRNGVRYFDDYEEFYWNVTGNDWPVPIDHASAFVTLPDGAATGLRAQAFTGAYGSKQRDADAQVNGADVSVETTHRLPARGGFTIDIYIPPGIVKGSEWADEVLVVFGKQSDFAFAATYAGGDGGAVAYGRTRSGSGDVGGSAV